jgi:hypothetical protein
MLNSTSIMTIFICLFILLAYFVVDFDTMCNYTARTRNFCGCLCTKKDFVGMAAPCDCSIGKSCAYSNHMHSQVSDHCNPFTLVMIYLCLLAIGTATLVLVPRGSRVPCFTVGSTTKWLVASLNRRACPNDHCVLPVQVDVPAIP